MIDFRELIKAGSHFGHQTSRWCPKMAPYIWGHKNKVHLIDISKTAFQLEKAAKFLNGVASEGKTILWVGTKKPAQKIISDVAVKLDMPYVNHRWIGGTLSNYEQVKKSVTKMLHYEDILSKAEKFPHYTKKELNIFQKLVVRSRISVGGIQGLKWPVGAIVLVDIGKERSALQEATMMGIPVVAIVDTNGDPSNVDYVIPANDDAPRSIQVIIDHLANGVELGKESAAKKIKAKAEAKEISKLASKDKKPEARPVVKKMVSKELPKKDTVVVKAKVEVKKTVAKPVAKEVKIEKNIAVKKAVDKK